METPSSSSACSTRWTSPRVSRAGVSSSTTTGWRALDHLDEQLDVLAAEQVGGVLPHDLGQVGGDDRGAVDDGRAGHLGLAPQLDRHPLGGQPEDRLAGRPCRAARPRSSPMARTVPAGAMPLAASTPLSQMTYVRRRQVEVVAGAHQRDDEAELDGDLAAQRLDPVEQVAAARWRRRGRRGRRRARARAGRPASSSAIASGESGAGSSAAAAAACASASSSTPGVSVMRAAMIEKQRRRRGGTAASAGRG